VLLGIACYKYLVSLLKAIAVDNIYLSLQYKLFQVFGQQVETKLTSTSLQ